MCVLVSKNMCYNQVLVTHFLCSSTEGNVLHHSVTLVCSYVCRCVTVKITDRYALGALIWL